jgi:hypothetical protein
MPHAAKNTMAYATSEKCVSVDTRQNAETKYATQNWIQKWRADQPYFNP